MIGNQEAWEALYRNKDRVWGGTPPSLPKVLLGPRILELGCGDGKSLHLLFAPEREVIAVDWARSALFAGRVRYRSQKVTAQISWVQADAVYLPFRSGTFSAISLVHILGHLPAASRMPMVGEVMQALIPGGIIIFRDFGSGDMRSGRGETLEVGTCMRQPGILVHYFTENEVMKLFEDWELLSLVPHRWSMRIRGKDYCREEVVGVFRKGIEI